MLRRNYEMDNQYQEHERNPVPLNPAPPPDPDPPLPPTIIIVPKKLGWVQYILIATGVVAAILMIIGMIFAIRGLMGG